jgi:hypothetical protein
MKSISVFFENQNRQCRRLNSLYRVTAAFTFIWLALLLLSPSVSGATSWTVLGWNNLGMHCMDADFSVFSILPPYNTVNAQLIDSNGHLVTEATELILTYQAVADPGGSINITSIGKTNFWQFVPALFGLALDPDMGLPVPGPDSYSMPGAGNMPQAIGFESTGDWYAAYGIPITPYDDALKKNPYPMMRLVAKTGAGATLANTDIVLPVSDEMDCRVCHSSGSGPAAQPAAGWVNDPNEQRDYRLNILSLHDDLWLGKAIYTDALNAAGYNSNGLFYTAANNNTPILCAACHLSEALPGSGQAGICPLTEAVHGLHAAVTDPANGMTLNANENRSACYRCHPGSETKCLRGVMGSAVAADGTMAMQCQSCHGSMSDVGASDRVGWLMEPNCQSCHTGDAVNNNGQIRYTSVFSSTNVMRVAVNQTFATNPDTPLQGLSLYRFSRGHGGLYCSACHGSTHAEFPAGHANDNISSIQHQGHAGMMVECNSCHGSQPSTVNGGPHGLHPLGQTWVDRHADVVEDSHGVQCRTCHGMDYLGTVLSQAQANRSISALGTKSFWRGFRIGCYTCHDGPGDDDANPNHPPVVGNASVTAASGTPVAVALTAKDTDRDALMFRLVSQPANGTVALIGTAATYFPDAGYVGGDSFTFAANDGQTDSNLGTIFITVGGSQCIYSISPVSRSVTALAGSGKVKVTAERGCAWSAASNAGWLTISSGGSGTGKGKAVYNMTPNSSVLARSGTLTVAGQTFTVTQAGSQVDATGEWASNFTQTGKFSPQTSIRIRTTFTVLNQTGAGMPRSALEVFLSDDATLNPASDLLLKNYKIGKIGAGKERVKKLSLKLPKGVSATGKHIIALVDADDVLPDMDDTNNIIPFGPLP